MEELRQVTSIRELLSGTLGRREESLWLLTGKTLNEIARDLKKLHELRWALRTLVEEGNELRD